LFVVTGDRLLLDALEKNPKMPETLANLAVVSVHLRRPPETVARYQKYFPPPLPFPPPFPFSI
jgi:hypothetical protein